MDNEVIVYQPDGETSIETRFDGHTVWLSQQEIAKMFGRSVKTISHHIKNAIEEELAGVSTFSNFEIVAADGKMRTVKCYNLDAVLSVGYRVKSPRGIQFRQWSNGVLRERLLRQNASQDALQARLDALERQMTALTGKAAPCAPVPVYAPPVQSDADVAARRDYALVSLLTREMIRRTFRNTMDDSVIFIRSETMNGWLQGYGLTCDDVRNMVESGGNTDFMPNYYQFPQSSEPLVDPQGLMFVGQFANPDNCTEIPVIGGSGKGVIVERVRGRQTYGVICRLALSKM